MDPISDMLTRIRNAQAVAHPTAEFPFSKIKYELAKLLATKGLTQSVVLRRSKGKKIIRIYLEYRDGAPAITGLRRLSKPGQRIYIQADKIRPFWGGRQGLAIISTSKGIMTTKEAKKKGLGGELLCEVW